MNQKLNKNALKPSFLSFQFDFKAILAYVPITNNEFMRIQTFGRQISSLQATES